MSIDWYGITRGDRGLSPQEILQVLPHRYPFLLVDRVLEIRTPKPLTPQMSEKELHALREGTTAMSIKNVTLNEPQFTGHFPGFPIFPGVLTIEALGQSAVFTTAPFLAAANKGVVPKIEVVLAGIDGVRLRKPVLPGDQLMMKVTLRKVIGALWSFEGVVEVEGKMVAEGSFIAHLSISGKGAHDAG